MRRESVFLRLFIGGEVLARILHMADMHLILPSQTYQLKIKT
ncbi:MAG: hypothetical protein ACLVC7_04405 [Monoglobus pectinilyticus]